MRQLEAILRGSLGFDIVLWILMALFLFWDILMSGRPFWRHMVQLCCCCCVGWVMSHVSPLQCPENYWVHVIVSLKQDASLVRMLSGFWRVNHTHGPGVTSDHALSLSTQQYQNKQHEERKLRRKLQVGALASSKKFLRKTKEIQNRKKTRPPLHWQSSLKSNNTWYIDIKTQITVVF